MDVVFQPFSSENVCQIGLDGACKRKMYGFEMFGGNALNGVSFGAL